MENERRARVAHYLFGRTNKRSRIRTHTLAPGSTHSRAEARSAVPVLHIFFPIRSVYCLYHPTEATASYAARFFALTEHELLLTPTCGARMYGSALSYKNESPLSAVRVGRAYARESSRSPNNRLPSIHYARSLVCASGVEFAHTATVHGAIAGGWCLIESTARCCSPTTSMQAHTGTVHGAAAGSWNQSNRPLDVVSAKAKSDKSDINPFAASVFKLTRGSCHSGTTVCRWVGLPVCS